MIELVFSRDGRPYLHQKVGETPLTIGRDHENHVQLTDEDISRRHCRIECIEGKYIVIDVSRNGTLLNNQPVKASPINVGDTMTIGQWTVNVVEADSNPKNTTVVAPRSPTSVLSFDNETKSLSFEKLSLNIESPDQKVITVNLAQSEAIIGTMSSCDIVLSDQYVSRKHCRVLHQNGRVILMDLGSTNGTYFENIRIDQVSLPPKGMFRIGKTLVHYQLDKEISEIEPYEEDSLGSMKGKSNAMREVFSLIERVAPSNATVLITGESGTGKELVARLLHQQSHRASRPFVSINCGALPASIIESQLFGHERGAFTGAVERMAGLFEQAHGGTLFLDEIGEMPLELQTRLLQVLENRTVRRLGGKEDIEIDFRLIAATNRELQRLASDGRFRSDLFYRLYVVPVNLAPLRERKDDIKFLAQHFVKEFSPPNVSIQFTESAFQKLSGHNWPGNVRELKNVIQRAILFAKTSVLDSKDISFAPVAAEVGIEHNLEIKERDTIIAALKNNKCNQTKTAKQLGIARTTLSTKITKYQIDLSELK